MDELISYQITLLNRVNNNWQRYLYPEFKNSKERLLGIKGLRGVGKTTMLLQYLAYDYPEKNKGLYVTADHPYFYQNTLFDLAGEWYRNGGKLLLIDEVHKYLNWSRELKLIYDGYPDLRVVFTSSSALDLFRGESDLSRRLMTMTLHGLSFREYLSYKHEIVLKKYPLNIILENPASLSSDFPSSFRPLPFFRDYLKSGYFPFSKELEESNFTSRLIQIINTVLESDLSYIKDYSASNINKIKNLLGVIASSAPFEPNISKIAEKLHLGRNTVNQYLQHLRDAFIVSLVNKSSGGISQLQKPDKIYFENPAFAYALQHAPNIGTIRETFFYNQLNNAGHNVFLSSKGGDFQVDKKWIFEIGGKNKGQTQIIGNKNAYLASDDIEFGFGNKIPLWLFGLLY